MRKKVNKQICILSIFIMVMFLVQIPTMTVNAEDSSVIVNCAADSWVTQTGEANVNIDIKGVSSSSKVVPTDIVLMLDQSGSMSGKIESLKLAVNNFIDTVDMTSHRVSIVPFSDSVTSYVPFTTNKSQLHSVVNSMSASGGTYIASAINKATQTLTSDARDGAKPVIILLTDGDAHDCTNANAAAQTAKANGFIFYTIALLSAGDNPDTSTYNSFLKKLATTEVHHNYVGAEKLNEIYGDVASDIGVENPYNVKVTATLSDNFNLVQGSADNNSPMPTISEKTMIWEMLEVKDSIFTFDYKVTPKDGLAVGTYTLFQALTVSYENYDGLKKTIDVKSPVIEVTDSPQSVDSDYEFILSQSYSKAGVRETVKVAANKSMVYSSDFEVKLGTIKLDVSRKSTNYFNIIIPSSVNAGEYDITIQNAGKIYNIGKYTIVGTGGEDSPTIEDPIDIPIGDYILNVTSSVKGVTQVVKAQTTTSTSYGSDFEVKMGDTKVTLWDSYICPTYFKFYVPTSLGAGTYDVVMINNGKTKTIGTYTITEKPEETPGEYELETKEVVAGKAEQLLKVSCTKTIIYGSDFCIKVGGEIAKINETYKTSGYFKFYLPTTLSAGTYDVVMMNNGEEIIIDQLVVTGEPTPTETKDDYILETKEAVAGKADQLLKVTSTKGITYGSDFCIKVGEEIAKINTTYKTAGYFKFYLPTTLSSGTYDVMMTNNSKEIIIDQLVVTGISTPVETKDNYILETKEAVAGKTNQLLKVTCTKAITYGSDFCIKVGGETAKINETYKTAGYFKFYLPTTLNGGTYDVVMSNNGQEIVIDQIVVNGSLVPANTAAYTLVDKAGYGGRKDLLVKVTGSPSITYGSDFCVKLGSLEVKVSSAYKNATYFRFIVPKTVAKGIYDVEVTNNGTTTVIGQYTVK